MGYRHPFADVDVGYLLSQLTLEEKVSLLTGQGSFKTTEIPDKGIPSITVSLQSRTEYTRRHNS